MSGELLKHEDQLARIEAVVSGRVQMVMFRDFTARRAKKLGLSGTVENLSDGSVKVVARGREEKLEKLIEVLHKGPPLANVKDVSVTWKEVSSEPIEGFRALYKKAKRK